MFKKVEGLDVEAVLYAFHDPPREGKRLMRATTAAYLLPTGELFIGCSCASERDQFEKAIGLERAKAHALYKLTKWVRKSLKAKPDAIIVVSQDLASINKQIREECLHYQLETFRLLLRNRCDIIIEISDGVR